MRLPRLALTAWCIGASTCSSTKTTPTSASGTARLVAALHRADQRAHRDREHRRQHAAQQQHDPPGDRQPAVGRGSTAKNFHSLRSRSPAMAAHTLPQPCERITPATSVAGFGRFCRRRGVLAGVSAGLNRPGQPSIGCSTHIVSESNSARSVALVVRDDDARHLVAPFADFEVEGPDLEGRKNGTPEVRPLVDESFDDLLLGPTRMSQIDIAVRAAS